MGDSDPDDVFGGELADLARSGAREWERDVAVWEADAEMLRLRRRSLADLLWEAMQRGDEVTVAVGEHSFSGAPVAVRSDLATMPVGDLTVALNLGAVDWVSLEPRRHAGTAGDRTYGSFRAYLGMLEVEGLVVRLVGERLDVRGRVEVLATDHVLVAAPSGDAGTTRWAIPVGSIGAVITPAP